jgi:hypothetical protein
MRLGSFDFCSTFGVLLALFFLVQSIKAWKKERLLYSRPDVWEVLELQKRESRQATLGGIFGFLIRLLLRGR